MIEMLRRRRSIREFLDRPIPPEIRRTLEEALLRSPTSRNLRPCQFIFVEDPQTLAALSRCKPHSAELLAGAKLAVVIIADERTSDVWIEDSAIAAITLQYVAETLGLRSCWVQVRLRGHASGPDAEHIVQQQLGIPCHFRVSAMVALGYAAKQKRGVPMSALDRSKLHTGRFQETACIDP